MNINGKLKLERFLFYPFYKYTIKIGAIIFRTIMFLSQIANHFPKLHMDLQKFAVAFEELIEDETNSQVYNALRTTQSYLLMMLCEVESTILSLPSLQLPTHVERSIMSSIERDPVDDTRRLIRDWGVILKYRDYLHAWRHVFNY